MKRRLHPRRRRVAEGAEAEDGVFPAIFCDGFGLIRASNTTPVLVLRFEGHTESALQRIQTQMLALLRTVKADATFKAPTH